MADGKWIHDLAPEMPLIEAARHVLEVRLRIVHDYLPRAVHEADRDSENVHQLRVGTRRADAALRIFANCFSKKVYRRARQRLRTIRRAAGAARDWDVFLIDLGERRQRNLQAETPGLDCVAGYALGQRTACQAQLETVCLQELPVFEEFQSDLLEAIRPLHDDPEAILAQHAQPLMRHLLTNLEAAASQDLTDHAALHQVRIKGKRLRYAMELFADCFAEPFREELYPHVEAMQDVLGRTNDSHVAVERLIALREQFKRAWRGEWKRFQAGVNGLLGFHKRRYPQERQRFLRLWEEWCRPESAGLWESVLAGVEHAVAVG
jgi:CHAD domain-containing protein